MAEFSVIYRHFLGGLEENRNKRIAGNCSSQVFCFSSALPPNTRNYDGPPSVHPDIAVLGPKPIAELLLSCFLFPARCDGGTKTVVLTMRGAEEKHHGHP